ncbi:MAG TPA: hypothetical protein VFK37_04100 [Bacillales bacterium]|nr:hypothetical protein [Bacillales bacterium]
MSYLIKGASELNGATKEFLIRERKIAYVAKKMGKEKAIELNCGGFYIVPGSVAVDFSIAESIDYLERKKKFIEWQRRGWTTILVVCPLQYENDLRNCLKKIRHLMINSSVDYVIGVSFPMHKITPSFIRLCRREKVPFIYATVIQENDWQKVTWEWIRDAMFTYRLPIVPDLRDLALSSKQKMKCHERWLQYAAQIGLPTISEFPQEDGLLKKEAIRKIGISPYKGELRIGCDLDYSLYQSTSLVNPIQFLYDKESEPDVVVLRGKLMKAGETVYYRPGYGKEVVIRVPGYLASYKEDHELSNH